MIDDRQDNEAEWSPPREGRTSWLHAGPGRELWHATWRGSSRGSSYVLDEIRPVNEAASRAAEAARAEGDALLLESPES